MSELEIPTLSVEFKAGSARPNLALVRTAGGIAIEGDQQDDAQLETFEPFDSDFVEAEDKNEEVAYYDDSKLPLEDSVKLYLIEIGKEPLLTAEEEVELSKIIEAGVALILPWEQQQPSKPKAKKTEGLDLATRFNSYMEHASEEERIVLHSALAARKRFVTANLRLSASIAKRYRGQGLDLIDLMTEGNLGIIRAVDKFDYTKGYKFSTYATWWVKQAITHALADRGNAIRVPAHKYEQIKKLGRIMREAEQQGIELTNHDIAAKMNEPRGTKPGSASKEKELLTEARVKELRQYHMNFGSLPSLDQPFGEDEDHTLQSVIANKGTSELENNIDNLVQVETIMALLKGLNAKEKIVIIMRHGMVDALEASDYEEMRDFNLDSLSPEPTLEELGKCLYLTRERVRQIEGRAIEKMRRNAKKIFGELDGTYNDDAYRTAFFEILHRDTTS